jgi:hypothetical protein
MGPVTQRLRGYTAAVEDQACKCRHSALCLSGLIIDWQTGLGAFMSSLITKHRMSKPEKPQLTFSASRRSPRLWTIISGHCVLFPVM